MELDDQLCFALYSATHQIQRLYRPLLDEVGLTYPQYLVLLVLWQRDGLTVSEIGQRLSLSSATLTPLLQRLQTAGFVSRERSEVDQRRVSVRLTAPGQQLKTKVRAITNAVTCAARDASEDPGRLLADLCHLRSRLPESI